MTATINRHATVVAKPKTDLRAGVAPDETIGVPMPTPRASRRSNVQQPITLPTANGSAAAAPNVRRPKALATPNAEPVAALNVPEQQGQTTTGNQRTLALLLWDPVLHTLATGLDDVEQVRIAQANRYRVLTATEPDSDGETRGFGLTADHPAVAALDTQLQTLNFLEKEMTKALQKQLKAHPLHPWIKAQKGLGAKQVARLLAAIKDPYWNDLHDRPRTVSELWAFCGLHVLPASHTSPDTQTISAGGAPTGSDTDQLPDAAQRSFVGVAPSRRRGQKSNWSDDARKRIYVIAVSCMKNRQSPYRAVYDAGREKYADSVHAAPCVRCAPRGAPAPIGSPLSDGHKHARAMRLVMKEILRDLWVEAKRHYPESETA